MNNHTNPNNNNNIYRQDIKTKNSSNHDLKVSRTTKQLEELFKIRELQKKKMGKFLDDNFKKTSLFEKFSPETKNYDFIPRPADNINKDFADNSNDDANSNTMVSNENLNKKMYTDNSHISDFSYSHDLQQKKYHHYNYLWDAYWPFIGSCDFDPKLDIELDFLTFNGILMEKWTASLPTPPTSFFPLKDIFKFTLITNNDDFDFDIKMENLPANGNPIVINITPNSTVYPFNLNQYIIIKDPNIQVVEPGNSQSDVLALLSYYYSNESYLNQFTQTMDIFDQIKNIFMSTQFFMVHINQVKDFVKLSFAHTTTTGENLFEVNIETDQKVEIKETFIPVIVDPSITINDIGSSDIAILVRTVYVNSKYFMTYATYVNNIIAIQQLLNVSESISDLRQTPIQLATMLLFDAKVPLTNLDNVIAVNDQQRLLIRLFKDVLQKNP
jgi:hypothetical protein